MNQRGNSFAAPAVVMTGMASTDPAPAGRSAGEGPATGPTDEALVARLRGGDAAAGEVLVGRYAEPLLKYLRRLVGGQERAEEVHQQAWLSVLEHLDQFDETHGAGKDGAGKDGAGKDGAGKDGAGKDGAGKGGVGKGGAGSGSSGGAAGGPSGGFKPWLYRIATNKAHDHHRRGGRDDSARRGYGRMRLAGGDGPMGAVAPPPGDRAERDERAERLRAAVDALPEPQRQVVLLRYYAGMKFAEIADLVGCPLNTALGRMHKASAKLRKAMDAGEGI